VPLIHFANPNFGKLDGWQKASYFLEIPVAPEAQIEVFLKDKHELDSISNASIDFYYKVQ
jgi:hypothetical protein